MDINKKGAVNATIALSAIFLSASSVLADSAENTAKTPLPNPSKQAYNQNNKPPTSSFMADIKKAIEEASNMAIDPNPKTTPLSPPLIPEIRTILPKDANSLEVE